jgi:hypothetical protein
MRLCVIGNSQIACLAAAWAEGVPHPPDLSLRFHGASGDWLRSLVWDGARLASPQPRVMAQLARTSGTDGAIRPAEWDGFLLVGLRFGLGPPERADWPDRRLSGAVRRALRQQALADSTLGAVLALIRRHGNGPVWILPDPLPRPGDGPPLTLPAQVQTTAEALADTRALLDDAMTRVLAQPPDTILHDRWTRPDYGEGAIGLAPDGKGGYGKPPEDRTHMNAAFGRRLWAMLEAAGLGG